jgi:hypothetical protein
VVDADFTVEHLALHVIVVDHKYSRGSTVKKILISVPMLFAISGAAMIPAAAQTTTEYYVVQDVKTKKCTIVDKRPTTTTECTVLGNGFKTRTEADGGMKTEKICTSN